MKWESIPQGMSLMYKALTWLYSAARLSMGHTQLVWALMKSSGSGPPLAWPGLGRSWAEQDTDTSHPGPDTLHPVRGAGKWSPASDDGIIPCSVLFLQADEALHIF